MPRRNATLFVVLLVAGACLLGIAVWRKAADPYGLNVILEDSGVSAEVLRSLAEALEPLLSMTEYADRYSINEPRRTDYANLYLFDARALAQRDRRFRAYENNCAYTGSDGIILCDYGLLRRFLEERSMDRQAVTPGGARPVDQILPTIPVKDETLRGLMGQMAVWVIGHELGHMSEGHGSSHFQESEFFALVQDDRLSAQRELDADRFVIETLNDPEGTDREFYAELLFELLNRDIRMRLCPGTDPLQHCDQLQYGAGIIYNNEVSMAYSTEGTHPEHLIRLLRLIDLADDRYGMSLAGYQAKQIIAYLLEPER